MTEKWSLISRLLLYPNKALCKELFLHRILAFLTFGIGGEIDQFQRILRVVVKLLHVAVVVAEFPAVLADHGATTAGRVFDEPEHIIR